MGDKGESKVESPQINPATIMAFLAIVGGVWFAFRPLSSDRPVVPPGTPNDEISEQKIDTRLWEDPFSALQTESYTNRLGDPSAEIAQKLRHTRLETRTAGQTNGQGQTVVLTKSQTKPVIRANLQLLAVMAPGGPASEDREDRIRSRFALVSALAESGYAPENPGHIGIGRMSWPSSLELKTDSSTIVTKGCDCALPSNSPSSALLMATGAVAKVESATNEWSVAIPAQALAPGGPKQTSLCTNHLNFAFEWFSRERFVRPLQYAPTNSDDVLLLWLDEDAFDDYPLSRLGLFFQQLVPHGNWITDAVPRLAVLGPRSSSTLRAMFPGEFQEGGETSEVWYHTNILHAVSLFLATPRAMDEVLVTNLPTNEVSRSAVTSRLTNVFSSGVYNFAATDSELAGEAFKELALRGVDLTNSNNKHHLVLVAGWDEFFGRMVTAAYVAELGYRQSGGTNALLRPFLDAYRTNGQVPTNLHTFFYFSGIDGQALYGTGEGRSEPHDDRSSDNGDETKPPKSWTPDANKAEGATQLDYLGRLGDRIQELDSKLREGGASVSAIGIAGGDVYDTLLILQALTPRFPTSVFFTTDLDARFWDPKELNWSRNLVVISGYGLQLSTNFQGGVAPFRDSMQTAQYAAALAALGNTGLCALAKTNIPIRRFEIGRRGPVDLSENGSSRDSSPQPEKPVSLREWLCLHRLAVLLSVLGGIALALMLSTNLRRLALFLASLWGADLAVMLSTRSRRLFVVVGTLAGTLGLWKLAKGYGTLAFFPAAIGCIALVATRSGRFRSALDRWRRFRSEPLWLREEYRSGDTADEGQKEFPFGEWLDGSFERRRDELRKRCGRLLLVFTFLCLGLAFCLLRATLADPSGRPFSLSGTTVWPTTWLCFLALAMGGVLLIKSFWELRQGGLETARNCRLETPEATSFDRGWTRVRRWASSVWWRPTSEASHVVDANQIWRDYWESGRGGVRLWRATALTAAYVVLTSSTYYLITGSLDPCFVRQPASAWYQGIQGTMFPGIMVPSYIVFLLLTFFTIDAALLCRWVIWRISQGPTVYPKATLEYFRRQRGQVPKDLLPDWIDVQIVSRIAERVGKLIYYPAAVILLLILAHHRFLYDWPWPPVAYALASCNFVLAGASVVILQRAAQRARDQSVAHLDEKLQQLRTEMAAAKGQTKEHELGEGKKLLDEMRGLNTGAFAGFWGNPVVRAVLVPSGGAVLLELLQRYVVH